MSKKLAILFPGIGYTCDKPLMYYAAKLCLQRGYELLQASYRGLRSVRFENRVIPVSYVEEALECALQNKNLLKLDAYDEVLIIGKSIGSAVGSAFAEKYCPKARSIWYTPIEATFMHECSCLGAFHGTNDPWMNTVDLMNTCKNIGIELYIIDKANHSLERGVLTEDIEILQKVMQQTAKMIE